MFKRGFSVAACGALALLLTAVQTSPAEFFPYVTFPVGRGGTIGAFGPTSYSYYPGYFGSPYYGSSYNNPYYGGYNPSYYQSAYSSYSVNTVTPLYYGSAGFAPSYNTAYSPARLVSPSLSSLAAINRGIRGLLHADLSAPFAGLPCDLSSVAAALGSRRQHRPRRSPGAGRRPDLVRRSCDHSDRDRAVLYVACTGAASGLRLRCPRSLGGQRQVGRSDAPSHRPRGR